MEKITLYPELEQAYKLFRTQVHNPKSVLYPCCATDATPSKVFDNVTYIDLDKEFITTLQQAKLNAYYQDIRSYHPTQPHDLLILLNPAIPPEWATQHLQTDGYIIANNWHETATTLHYNPKFFDLYGTINYKPTPTLSTDLTNLFHPIKDEQEFQQYRPKEYEFMKKVISNFASQRTIPSSENASFTEQLQAFCQAMDKEMPYRRVCDLYIFKKK